MPAVPRISAASYGLIFWPWAVADIPSGWNRDTNFDVDGTRGRYLQGHATTAGTNGGGSHTHTLTHTHTGNAHYHTYPTSGSGTATQGYAIDWTPFEAFVAGGNVSHTHAGFTGASQTATYDNATCTTAAATSDPAYMNCLLLKPDASGKSIPEKGVSLLSPTATIPGDHDVCDGTAGTRDMDGKFLRGAPSGGDGGGTGGSATHDHGGSVSHTHTSPAHTHPDKQCGIQNTWKTALLDDAGAYIAHRQHHDVTDNAVSAGTTSSTAMSVAATSSEPAHMELVAVQAQASAIIRYGQIIGFTGTTGDLAGEDEWVLCDGSNGTPDLTTRQIKVTTNLDAAGTLEGADNHTHQGGTHGHTHASYHDHGSRYEADIDYTQGVDSGGDLAYTNVKHTTPGHVFDPNTQLASLQDKTAFTSSASDKRAHYRTVLWIMCIPNPSLRILGKTTIKGLTRIAGA